jgi:hypothetical protein
MYIILVLLTIITTIVILVASKNSYDSKPNSDSVIIVASICKRNGFTASIAVVTGLTC